jgi:hypothetical protein
MSANQQYPTLEQFAANVAAVIGKIEVIEQELYDRIFYPTAGLQAFTFFATPKGAGQATESGSAAGAAKTLADTNMTQNGQLPAPQAFWIDNIQLDFDPGSVATANLFVEQPPQVFAVVGTAVLQAGWLDKNLIINAGFATLNIGQKPYYTHGPLHYFPPRAQKRIDIANGGGAVASFTQTGYVWIDGALRTLDPGLGLATGFNFDLTVQFPVLQATPSGFNGRLKAILGGWLFRAAQ